MKFQKYPWTVPWGSLPLAPPNLSFTLNNKNTSLNAKWCRSLHSTPTFAHFSLYMSFPQYEPHTTTMLLNKEQNFTVFDITYLHFLLTTTFSHGCKPYLCISRLASYKFQKNFSRIGMENIEVHPWGAYWYFGSSRRLLLGCWIIGPLMGAW